MPILAWLNVLTYVGGTLYIPLQVQKMICFAGLLEVCLHSFSVGLMASFFRRFGSYQT